MNRFLDIVVSVCVLLLTWPFFVISAIGIKLTSPGPLFYVAARVGRDAVPFRMLKFRSMHVHTGGAAITGGRDPRIFRFGRILRKLKFDELPQFLNVLKGDMAIVGPRPEDPGIVARAYSPWMMETLAVKPGITSPGSLYYYAYGEDKVDPADPEGSYITALLPSKLAIDRAYMERATVPRDINVIFWTAISIIGLFLGFKVPPARQDMDMAKRWVTAL